MLGSTLNIISFLCLPSGKQKNTMRFSVALLIFNIARQDRMSPFCVWWLIKLVVHSLKYRDVLLVPSDHTILDISKFISIQRSTETEAIF